MKTLHLGITWIKTGIKSNQRRNFPLHGKFSKSRTTIALKTYKQYKKLFERDKEMV